MEVRKDIFPENICPRDCLEKTENNNINNYCYHAKRTVKVDMFLDVRFLRIPTVRRVICSIYKKCMV